MSDAPYGERRAPSTRFLPPDPAVAAPYRLTPGLALRVGILGVLALAVFAVLFFRLWSLQVLSGNTYLAAAQGNQLRTIRIEAPRGTILDRDGRVIVDNVPGTAVKLWVADLPAKGRYDVIRRLAWVLDVRPVRLAQEVDSRVNDPLNPITVKTAVGEDQISYLYEHQADFPGVQIQQTYLRHYPYQSLGAQLLGYVGEVSQQELDAHPKLYKSGDKVGKTGVEAKFDQELRGEAGEAQIRVDSMGRPHGARQPKIEPRPGSAVRLTIDMIDRVHRSKEKEPLFERFGVEQEIASTLDRRVDLPSGGYLVFDYAEAFTVIDVNTGRFVGSRSKSSSQRLEDTVVKNNLEAVKEVVRQLRLRDIGGIIVIDFIDMANPKNRQAVEDALRQELERDRTKTYVVEISPLGLVEMTRQNVTDGPREVMTRKCPTCGGDGIVVSDATVALDVERKLRALAAAGAGSRIQAYRVELHPRELALVAGPGGERLAALEEATRRRFYLVPAEGHGP